MLKLGTHNSMTYLEPTDLPQALVWPTGKCQDLTLEEQYEFGVRLFDLRIRFTEEGIPYFAHGFLEFHKKSVVDVLDFLNRKQGCVVNLVMESFGNVKDTQDHYFIDFCKMVETEYEHVTFIGGWSKYPASGHSLYSFAPKEHIPKNEVYKVFTLLNEAIREGKEEIQKPTGKLEDIAKKILKGALEFVKTPLYYAMKNNPDYWNNVSEITFTMMDYVQIGAPESYVSQQASFLRDRIKQLAKEYPKFKE